MTRSIVRWAPNFQLRDLDHFFEENWEGGDFSPAIDVRQEKDNVIVETSLPGIDADKIEISVENDVLTIAGHTEEKKEIKREDYYRKEIREGSFSRSVILPMGIKASEAEASYDKGVLKITMPKAEQAKPKKILIKTK
ncbi:MAG: Hsp20/alpha crystallin family protein [Candidatus Moranbacteria bacterium]|nr:Hsp20/alpha crystallin family protein [Candidatus Moranbacteria bacterium]